MTGDGRPDVLFGGTGVDPLLFAQTSGGTLAPPRIVSGAGGGTHQRLLELSDVDGDGDPTNDDTDGDGTPDYLDPIDNPAPPVRGEEEVVINQM